MTKSTYTQSDNATRRPQVLSVEELTQRNVETVLRLEEAAKEQRARSDRVAEVIARFCGSMTFVWVHVVWFGEWATLQSAAGDQTH